MNIAAAEEPPFSVPDATPNTCDSHSTGWHHREARKTIDAGWKLSHWRSGPKRSQLRQIRDHLDCLERVKDRKKLKGYLAHKRSALRLYRAYRRVTPYRCQSGPYGTWAVPCYIVSCESRFSWGAANPSGAIGPYQLLGWGAPWPVRNFRDKLRHHQIAHSLALSNWVCA